MDSRRFLATFPCTSWEIRSKVSSTHETMTDIAYGIEVMAQAAAAAEAAATMATGAG